MAVCTQMGKGVVSEAKAGYIGVCLWAARELLAQLSVHTDLPPTHAGRWQLTA